jgi:hypothetical protein
MGDAEVSEDVTAVMRRHGVNKTLSMLIGFGIALCSAAGSYYAYRRAREEARAATHEVRATADVGYQTSTQAITLLQAAVREHDAEIAWLKLVCKPQESKMSLTEITPPPPTPTLAPLQRAKLFRVLPQTLDDADTAADSAQ